MNLYFLQCCCSPMFDMFSLFSHYTIIKPTQNHKDVFYFLSRVPFFFISCSCWMLNHDALLQMLSLYMTWASFLSLTNLFEKLTWWWINTKKSAACCLSLCCWQVWTCCGLFYEPACFLPISRHQSFRQWHFGRYLGPDSEGQCRIRRGWSEGCRNFELRRFYRKCV